MSKYIIRKNRTLNKRKSVRFFGLIVAAFGIVNLLYFFFPFFSWHVLFAPAFAQQNVVAPVPTSSRLNLDTLGSLFSTTMNTLSGVDYTDARNWFPDYKAVGGSHAVPTYTISIPKLGITNAEVTTQDNDLKRHLVNYGGTAIPPEKGTAVIYGHSTLPSLFNQNDYKTIFATLHTLKPGDKILATVNNVTYTYRIDSMIVVEADDTSVHAQDFTNSHLTVITCTPPGTIWKRLVVKATMEKL